MRKKLNSKGFTLIELLIVIIIIGILAAIAFVAFSGSQNKAHKADAQSTLGQVKTKLGEYYADHSSYPAVSTTDSTANVDTWLKSDEGGHNKSMASTFTDANHYSYSVEPSGCGDTVSVDTDGTVSITQGTACTGFTLTADKQIWNGDTDITVNN